MRRILFSYIALLLLFPYGNTSAEEKSKVLLAKHKGRKFLYLYKIDRQEFNALPIWSTTSGESPPLEISDAIRLARNWVTKNRPDFETNIISINLVPLHITSDKITWVYKIPITSTLLNTYLVVVTMDGKVIEPIKEIPTHD